MPVARMTPNRVAPQLKTLLPTRTPPALWFAALAGSGVLGVLVLNVTAAAIDHPGLKTAVLLGALAVGLFVARAREALLAAMLCGVVWFSGVVMGERFGDLRAGRVGMERVVLEVGERFMAARPVAGLQHAYSKAFKLALPVVTDPVRMREGVRESLPVPGIVDSRSRYLDAVNPREPQLRELAVELTRKCKAQDRGCEMNALLRHVARDVKYVSDPRGGADFIQSPEQTLALKAGDCEDQTILLSSMLESVGVRTLLAFTDDHVYAMGCVDKPVSSRWLGRGAVRYDLTGEGRTCYPLEPTSPHARVGQEIDHEGFKHVVDPVSRTVYPFERAR